MAAITLNFPEELYNESLERIVLGTLMQRNYAYPEVCDLLSQDMFTTPTTTEVYAAIKSLQGRCVSFDGINVADEIRRSGGKTTMVEVSLVISSDRINDELHTSPDLLHDVLRLKDLAMRRQLMQICVKTAGDCGNLAADIADTLAEAKKRLDGVVSESSGDHTMTAADAVKQLQERIQRNMNGTDIGGISTGFHDIDRRGGLQPGSLIVVAAETSMGKTAFAQAMAASATKAGAAVAFYSMEMTAEEVMARLYSGECGIPVRRLLYDPLTQEELQRFLTANPAVLQRLYFDENSVTSISKIINSIRAQKMKRDIKVAIIDYLQILNINTQNARTLNKEQQMGEAARLLKNVAKETGVCVVAVSQLNRTAENGTPPTIARLRDSGQIAEAADNVLLIYRAEYYSKQKNYPAPFEKYSPLGTAMVDVAKGRNIGTFKFLVRFEAETTHFADFVSTADYPIRTDAADNGRPF